ncbi:low-density lipoprotein receptor-related protein 2-like [Saccoglossus kowalevskii]
MGGNFTRFQAFVGELTDFNLWDYGLTLSDIATNLVDGCAHGSLFSWGRDLLAVFNAVDITDDEGISQCGNIYYDNPIGPLLLVADHLTTALPSLSDSDSRVIYYNYSGQALYDRARTSGPNVPYKAVHREFLHNSEKMVLGFDYMDLIFFWSDPGHKAIYVADWVNGQRSFVHTGTSTTVEGIAVDWLTKHVYWTDAEYNWIKVANYNGTNHRTLITTGLDKPAGIVCDPIKGYLYWCDWGNENKIERATLSGESRTVLVGSDVLGTPVGLTLDLRYNMLYWSDEQNKKIMRLNLNDATPDPQVVVHEPDSFGRIFSMDIDYEFGFFANDREHDVIHLVPFDTNMDVLQISNNYDPNGLVYFDEARQPIEDFSCSSSPCSHMCVGDPSGYKCLCNHGYKLKNDGRRCEEDESIILDHELVFSVEGGYLCQVPANIGHEHLPETFTVSCFSDFTVNTIDFDVYGEYIFVHSKQYPGIQRSRLRYEDDNEWEHVTLEGDPSCISVDWIGSNLYWTSGKDETASIKVSTLEGEHVTTLISQDIREPKAIAVHATSMYLFWSDKGDSPRIERSDLRGRYRKVLVTENIEDPVQFAIDFNRDRLYWGDDGTKQIVSVDFDGYDRTLFRMFVHDSDVRFTGLTIFQDFMFVARYSEVSITIYEIESRQRVRVILPPTKPTTLKFFHSSLQPLDIGPCDTYIFCDEICVNTRYGAECLCSEDSRGCQTVYRCPLTFANGSVTDGCDNRDGNSCQYSCEKGYFPTTNQPIVCQENGEWEIPASSLCTPDGKCPRDFAHGSVTESCNNMIYNTCMYTCEDGFLPATTSAITCQESGVWDGDNDNICVSSTNGNDIPVGPVLLVADHLTTDMPRLTDADSRVIYYNYSGQALYDHARSNGPDVPYATLHREVLYESEKMVLSFDYQESILFWSDPGHKVIYKAQLKDDERSLVYTGTSSTVEGITVDWLTKHIYWTDAQYNWIKIANYDGTNHRTIITTGLDQPAGIVCDPIKGYLYWCDWGDDNKIEQSTLSGEGRIVLVAEADVGSDMLGTPVGLTLDMRSNVLYWSDEKNKKIMRLTLNAGTLTPQVVVNEPDTFGQIFSLDIDYNFGFFASDREHDLVHLVPFDTSKDVLQVSTSYDPNGLVYFDEARQPIEDFACSSSPCSHICVGDPNGYKCLCNHGYKLKSDRRRCEEDESIILDHELVFSAEGGYLCQIPANIGHEHLPETFTVSCFTDFTVNTLDFDVYAEYIFVHSEEHGGIQRARLRYDNNHWQDIILGGQVSGM